MPEDAIYGGSRLVVELLHQCSYCRHQSQFGIHNLHANKEMPRANVVEVVLLQVIASNVPLLIDHGVHILTAIVQNVLSAIAQIGVEHSLEFDTHHITPLGLCGEVQKVGMWRTFHLRTHHPLRITPVLRLQLFTLCAHTQRIG